MGHRPTTETVDTQPGPSRPGFVSGHTLAERGVWYVIGFAALLAAWLWYKHAVGKGVGIAAIILSLIFPPWIFPGAGLIVLTVATVITRSRLLADPERTQPIRPVDAGRLVG